MDRVNWFIHFIFPFIATLYYYWNQGIIQNTNENNKEWCFFDVSYCKSMSWKIWHFSGGGGGFNANESNKRKLFQIVLYKLLWESLVLNPKHRDSDIPTYIYLNWKCKRCTHIANVDRHCSTPFSPGFHSSKLKKTLVTDSLNNIYFTFSGLFIHILLCVRIKQTHLKVLSPC